MVLKDLLTKIQNKGGINERRVKRQARDEGEGMCKTCRGGEVCNKYN